MLKFKKGQRARVTADKSYHNFPIGEEVTIVEEFYTGHEHEHYRAREDSGRLGYISDSELEPIKEETNT